MQTALRLMAALCAVMAPAITAQVVVVQSAYAQAAPALPPPPYAGANAAGAPATPVRYGGMQVYDRYGGEVRPAQPAFAAPAGPAPMRSGPTLAWSGKVEAPASVAPAPPTPYAAAQAQASYRPAAYTQPNGAPRGWTFVQPIGAAAPGAPPSSIYDSPPPAAPAGQTFAEAQAQAQAQLRAQGQGQASSGAPQPDSQGGSGPRHYSLHRDYGIDPDPIPLPPQFFGATADLGQPATQDPIRKTVTGNGKSQNPLQPEGGQ